MYTVYKCGRGPHSKTRQAAIWTPMVLVMGLRGYRIKTFIGRTKEM